MVGVDQVVAERERGECLRPLPRGTEGRRHEVAFIEPPSRVRRFEATLTESAEGDVLAIPQHHQVDIPVAIDVDGVRAEDPAELDDRILDGDEVQRTSDVTRVAVQGGLALPAGDEHVRPTVVIAVEDRDPAPHREWVLAVVGVMDPRCLGLVDEPWRTEGGQLGVATELDD